MTEIQSQNRISLKGFSKESVELIRELEAFGWVFRLSNHGAVGHAPNDKTTTSVSRNLNKTNRSLRRAQADFKRWLRMAHPEIAETADEYVAQHREAKDLAATDPVTAEILKRRSIIRTSEKIEHARAEAVVQTTTTTENEESSMPSIASVEAMHFKKSKDDIPRVLRRTWSTGKVDFACSFPDCKVTSSNARSVAQHFGAMHSRLLQPSAHPIDLHQGTPAAAPTAAAPQPIEPAPATDGLPWEALAEVVEELRQAEPPSASEAATKQMIDEQYDMMTGDLNDDRDVVKAIRQLVSGPLLEQVKALGEQVDSLTKERDEAREHLAKAKSDWDALRALLGGHDG